LEDASSSGPLALALRRDPHHVAGKAELLESHDEEPGEVEFPAAKAMDCRAREGMVGVMPGLAKRGKGKPEDVPGLVIDVEAPRAQEVAKRN
jgi:hypothetical protein